MSPYTASGIADGPHTFQVRATDDAGSVGVPKASRRFSVDGKLAPTSLRTPRREKFGRAGRVKLFVGCDEDAEVIGSGSIKGRHIKNARLDPARKSVSAGDTVELRLKLARRRDRRTVLAALRRGGRVKATVSVLITDAAGNRKRMHRSIKLR